MGREGFTARSWGVNSGCGLRSGHPVRVEVCLWDPQTGLGEVQATGLQGSPWVPEHQLITFGLLIYSNRKPCQNYVFRSKNHGSQDEMSGLRSVFLSERLLWAWSPEGVYTAPTAPPLYELWGASQAPVPWLLLLGSQDPEVCAESGNKIFFLQQ